MPFHCPLTIGSEMQKAEQKPYHLSLLLSLKSSHWLLVTLLQGDDCTRAMSSHRLVLPLEWFNHKAVTGKASKAAKRAQWPTVWPLWRLPGLRGDALQRGLSHGVHRSPPSDVLSCSWSEPCSKLALCAWSGWKVVWGWVRIQSWSFSGAVQNESWRSDSVLQGWGESEPVSEKHLVRNRS